jgi:hypothetical protein
MEGRSGQGVRRRRAFMRRLLLTLLSASLVLFLGCGKSDPSGPGDTTLNWFPVEVGTVWSIQTIGTEIVQGDTIDIAGPGGIAFVSEQQHSQGFTVLEAITTNSLTYSPRGGGDTWTVNSADTSYYHVTEATVECYNDLDGTWHGDYLLLPLEVGDSWLFNEDSNYWMEVIGLSETVTVPAGTYENCAFIQETTEDYPVEEHFTNIFYANNVGWVKFIYHSVTTEETIDLVQERISG